MATLWKWGSTLCTILLACNFYVCVGARLLCWTETSLEQRWCSYYWASLYQIMSAVLTGQCSQGSAHCHKQERSTEHNCWQGQLYCLTCFSFPLPNSFIRPLSVSLCNICRCAAAFFAKTCKLFYIWSDFSSNSPKPTFLHSAASLPRPCTFSFFSALVNTVWPRVDCCTSDSVNAPWGISCLFPSNVLWQE